jgi:hypothetical protein
MTHAHKRPKAFTDGRQRPINRNDRARLLFLAKAARHRGELTRAAVDIFEALLYRFANMKDGRCIPSYKTLAEAAGCVERTVGRCLSDLERLGLVTWKHRLRRVRETVAGLPGIGATDWRVMRWSNAYSFPLARLAPAIHDERHSGSGTRIQIHSPSLSVQTEGHSGGESGQTGALEAALGRLGANIKACPA